MFQVFFFHRLEGNITFCADYKKLEGNVVENTLLSANVFAREIKKNYVELQYKLLYFNAY